MAENQYLAPLLAGLGLVVATIASIHAVLYKRRPQSAFGWIAVCLTLPLLGALLYYLFGINRVKSRARKLLTSHPEPHCPTEYVGTPPPQHAPLARLGESVTDWPLTAGNRVEMLSDAETIFRAMLGAIDAAQRYVYFATYILDDGPIGERFAAALARAAQRGVDVRLLLDGVGDWYSLRRGSALLHATSVRVARFLPPRLWPPTVSINLRNHRKSLVIDGREAFTGGLNIRNRYLATESQKRITDLHFRLVGPVVTQIEAVFLRDWHFVTGESDRPLAHAAPAPAGGALCRAVADGPDGELDRLTALYTGAIGAARQRVAIMTPYFLPPRELIAPLVAAALAGVDVAVILPQKNNLPYVHRATRHMLWELLERGVRAYYQPPPFAHSKLFYVDDHYAQIGSANFDSRSLRLNFEMNVEIYSRETVIELARHFEAVRAISTPITLASVDARSLGTKTLDGACWLFSPYL